MTPSPSPTTGGIASAIDWSAVAMVTGLILATVGIIVGAYFAWRYGSRRTKLQIDWRVRPLVPFSFVNEKGEVEVVGGKGPPQFGVELRIKNRGPQDIRAEHFEGHPMRLNLGAPVNLNGNWSNADSGLLDFESDTALLHPRRISADADALHYFVRCFGKRPNLLISSPPADVRVETRQFRDLDAHGLPGLDQFSLSGANKWLTKRVRYN
jgi:hypothetical protein